MAQPRSTATRKVPSMTAIGVLHKAPKASVSHFVCISHSPIPSSPSLVHVRCALWCSQSSFLRRPGAIALLPLTCSTLSLQDTSRSKYFRYLISSSISQAKELESRSITMSATDIIGVLAAAMQFSGYVWSKIMILLASRLWKSSER